MDAAFAIPACGSLSADGSARRTDTNGKRLVAAELPKAIDMSHHLSRLAQHRTASSLKQLYQYMTIPGMITMAGGARL
jgi:aromatic amino acid aminotransferase I